MGSNIKNQLVPFNTLVTLAIGFGGEWMKKLDFEMNILSPAPPEPLPRTPSVPSTPSSLSAAIRRFELRRNSELECEEKVARVRGRNYKLQSFSPDHI